MKIERDLLGVTSVEVELDAFPARILSKEIWGSRGIGLYYYISFPSCGTNLRAETCLYTNNARSGGVWGEERRGREATQEGFTAAAPLVRPQIDS